MIFADANVLLEVILQRSRAKVCETFLISDNDKAISILTLDLVMYFVERDNLNWRPIKTFLESFIWLPMIDSDAQWAFVNFKGRDFEDALQISCAKREGCEKFATLDKRLAKKYDEIMPIELLN